MKKRTHAPTVPISAPLLASAVAAMACSSANLDGTVEGSWSAVAAGFNHTCGIRTDATLWCWGNNLSGQVGDGTSEGGVQGDDEDALQRRSPVQVGADADWVEVSAGYKYACARKKSGALFCWGGLVGDGATARVQPRPVQVGGTSDWAQVSAGSFHTCARKTSGEIYCWGQDRYGDLGLGSGSRGESAPKQVGVGTDWAEVSAGHDFTCGRTSGGALFCWGNNDRGQLGDGTTRSRSTPVRVGADTDWAHVTAGGVMTCARKTSGALYCWGEGTLLGLGLPHEDALVPIRVGADHEWAGVRAGEAYTLALKTDGTLWGWGRSADGQLGVALGGGATSPVRIGAATGWVEVSLAPRHACARKADGTLRCWGYNADGRIGNGSSTSPSEPPIAPP